MNENKKRDIFYGIIAVATLIVAMIGATLAYFSITGGSEEGAVNATAATVSIEYNDGQQVSLQADQLIPSEFQYVKTSYETYVKNASPVNPESTSETPKCVDENNKQICSTYRFTISNAQNRALTATLNAEHNGFTTESLSLAVYDLKNNTWLDLDTTGTNPKFVTYLRACDGTGGELDACYQETSGIKTYNDYAIKSIFGVTYNGQNEPSANTKNAAEQEYELVLFINETGENQNVDQGKSFQGTIKVDVTNGSGRISGCFGSNCTYND